MKLTDKEPYYELRDKESHYIQNEIDLVMDMIRDEMGYKIPGDLGYKLCDKLENIRDSIPCCCDITHIP
jgi:hypothetical protein